MKTNSKNTDHWLSPKNIISIIQTVAILIGACWTIYLFFKFDREQKKLSIALLESQNIQAELTAQLSKLQIKKSELDVDQALSERVKFEHDIKITDLQHNYNKSGKDLFLIEYVYSIINNSNKKIEVTLVLVNSYLAKIPAMKEDSVVEIRDFRDNEGIPWIFLKSKGYYYSTKWEKGMGYENVKGVDVLFERGGGGTAELDNGEKSSGSMDLLILAREADIIGFEARIVINKGEKTANRWRHVKSKPLIDNTKLLNNRQ